jgi:translocation and assembly module TamB
MSKPARIALYSLGGIVFLVLVVAISALLIARSDWLREKIRAAIVEQAEKATGGRVEIRKFGLKWTGLTADIDGLVIHGSESPDVAPLLAVDHVTIGIRIISLWTRDFRLSRIDVTRPQVHLIIDADGGTNMPRPKVPGRTSTADAILNVKIGRFEVKNGEALVESPGVPPHKVPWSGSGQNLTALATYDRTKDRYSGNVSLAPLHLTLEGYGPLDIEVYANAAMERNRVVVSRAIVKSTTSEIDLTDFTTGSFAAPVLSANYDVNVSAAEAARVLHWKVALFGNLSVKGKAQYISPVNFDVSGAVRGAGLAFGSIRNIRIAGNLTGNQAKATLTGLRVNVLGGEAAGNIELRDYAVYRVNAKISGLGVRELAALGTSHAVPYDGLVSGTVDGTGRISDLSLHGVSDAKAELAIAPAAQGPAVNGQISAHYTGALITNSVSRLEMAHSWVQLPNTRLDVTGTLGSTLTVSLQTKDPDDLLPALNGHALPFSLNNGSAAFAGTVNGALADPHIAGHATVQNAVYEGRLVSSAVADVTASTNGASAANASIVYDGITASGNGSISLTDWATTNASTISGNLTANNVDITHALALSDNKNVEVSGTLSLAGRVSGTLGQPVAGADITLSKGLIYEQPYDSITTHVEFVNADLQTATGNFVSGPKRVSFDVKYPHAGQAFPAGTLQITASSNVMPLNQIALIRQRQPDIEGSAQFKGTGSLRISEDAKKAVHVELVSIDGEGSAAHIGLGGRDLGDSHFSAKTQGTTLTASFDSNAAKAVIKGEARVELTGDDRTTGSVTFSNAGLNALAALIVTEAEAKSLNFDGSAEGQIAFSGPLFTPKQMSVSASLGQFELHPLADAPLSKTIPGFSVHNSGPVKVTYDRSVIRIDQAHFVAPQTDVTMSGSADFSSTSPLNLSLQGEVNLAMVRNFVPDLASSGTLAVSGSVRGSFSTPDLSGHASIRGGEFHYADFTNGLTNATGEIVFSGTRATILSFNADTGGGKFTGTGFASLNSGILSYQFAAKTKDVRLRYPQGISSTSDSDIQIVQNSQRSNISGTITVRRLVFNPQTDAAGTLADMSYNLPTPAAGDNSLANMNLDVLIQTAPDVALQSKVAESIQADASLRLRGTVASPAMLGRVNISQGSVLFFGNKYTISRGSISFFNPTKIDPILDVDLQTKARGVDVTLTVTGPPSHLGMTYRSDPPLEFSDIVALLATGRTPDDPSVALRGNAPTPSFEQLGASTLIGETLATPVAGRLQRFFGVSRIKIDPQLVGLNGNPGARLTVEQQITPDILFTYVTDVSNTSEQLIRAQWDFNPKWSAILAREENGYVGVDFEYKIRFK